MLNQRNTRKQGDVGVAMAISFFTKRGDTVSLPIGEARDYDIIVDINGSLKKVQVKTTRSRHKRHGRFQVQLETKGGNRSWSGVSKEFDPTNVDILFVVTDDGTQYCIEASAVGGTTGIILGEKYVAYKVV